MAFIGLLALGMVSSCSRRLTRARSGPVVYQEALAYPTTRTVDHQDEYHGTAVADPYRWLEDFQSDEAKAWVAAQNEVTNAHLASIQSRPRIKKRLESLWNYQRFGVPWSEAGRYFFFRNDGLQDHAVLYTADSPQGEGRILLDPNTMSDDKSVSVADTSVSRDGRYLAYAISRGGSDWREIFVRDVETGEDLAADHIQWVKFSSINWAIDNSGFYYSRMPAPEDGAALKAANYNQKVYFHRVGTPQAEDTLIYERPDQPEWGLSAGMTEDGQYLVIWVWRGSGGKNTIFYRDLAQDGPITPLFSEFDARYVPIATDGTKWTVFTNKGAPKGRIVSLDIARPDVANWHEVVPESRFAIDDVEVMGERIVVNRMEYARSKVSLYRLDGTFEKELPLPLGSVGGFRGKRADSELFFSFSSFTIPSATYRYDVASGKLSPVRKPKVDFDPSKFTTRQVAYTSRDGQDVTMFIVHKKGLVLDGSNPTLLYGYGGFNAKMRPRFNPARIVWMEWGGVYALANLRGGGEYGEAWHRAGMRDKKQNVFDDFIAAGEALITNGYTSKSKLAIQGGSNGGLLVGACMNQRPDLFAACLPAVGVMDMLRFQEFTIGRAWVAEYGSSADPKMFPVLYRYSPLHNIKNGVSYPATLVTTADRDDRVVPAHSFKYIARLQAAQGGKAPVLIRVETQAGHGAGTSTSKYIELVADQYAFLTRHLGMRRGP